MRKMNVRKMVTYGLGSLVGVPLIYSALMITGGILEAKTSPITSQQQLDMLLEKGKAALGCDENVRAVLVDKFAAETKSWGGQNLIRLGGEGAKEGVLKHEVYHVCDGHTKLELGLNYLWLEPQATLYAVTGLRW